MFWFNPTNTAMVNTIRALSVSTLILLASCLMENLGRGVVDMGSCGTYYHSSPHH
jgi:hypothetical protein